MTFFRVEGQEENESDLPASAVLSDAKVPWFRVACPEPHQHLGLINEYLNSHPNDHLCGTQKAYFVAISESAACLSFALL